MAASNNTCFQKKCQCASCNYICSRCAITVPITPEGDCVGEQNCPRWDPLTWKEYRESLGPAVTHWPVTEEEYLEATKEGGN